MILAVPVLALALLLSGLAIAYVIGAGAVLAILPQRVCSRIDVFALMALPLFILAGELMNRGGITAAVPPPYRGHLP